MERLIDPSGVEVTVNREATAKAYSQLAAGSTDTCKCLVCANYRAQRSRAMFSAEMLSVFDKLGIDPLKEAETTGYPYSTNQYVYDCELPFIGSFTVGKGASISIDLGQQMWRFAIPGPPVPTAFGDEAIVVRFTLRLPWVLEERMRSDWRISPKRLVIPNKDPKPDV